LRRISKIKMIEISVIVHRRVAKRMNIFLSADPRGIGSPCGIPHRGFCLTAEIPRGKHFTGQGRQKEKNSRFKAHVVLN